MRNYITYKEIRVPILIDEKGIDIRFGYTSSYVYCKDDSNKPEDIKLHNWIRKGHIYRLNNIMQSINQITSEVTGVVVLFNINPNNSNYCGYNINRFSFILDSDN